MTWRTEHTTTAALLLAFALPVFTVFAAYHTAGDLSTSQSWVRHSQDVLLGVQRLQLDTSSAGAAERAYLLHPAPDELDDFHAQIAAARKELLTLRQLTPDNPTQLPHLAELETALDTRTTFMDQVLALRRRSDVPALELADSAAGLSDARAVRAAAAGFEAEENRLLAERRVRAAGFQRAWTRLFWAACIGSLLLILACFIMLVREVRERRRTQEALHFAHTQLEESWERYHSLIANVPVAVWTIRRNGESEYISSRIHEISGYQPGEVVRGGSGFWLTKIHPDDQGAVRAAFDQLFDAGLRLEVEFRLQRKDASWTWVKAEGQHVYDKAGERLADGVFADITDRKNRAARELEQQETAIQNRERERANEVKTQFLASVSHELRTPLSAILGFSDLLLQGIGGAMSPDQMEFVGHIQRGGNHLLELINDILDLTKLESGAMRCTPQPLRLDETAEEALNTVAARAAAKSLQLEASIAVGLTVMADPLRTRQILINLLSNAVKFTGPGGQVNVTAERRDGRVVVRVSDTGVGIPPEYLETIFERFQQVGDTTQGVKEGTGLGLAITRQLVHMHGGSIQVESKPGKGSCFTFDLPLVQGANGAAPMNPPKGATAS